MLKTSPLPLATSVLLALFLGSAWGQGANLGFIEVHGNGIDGATVYLSDQLKGRIENGSLIIPNVYPGTYTLRVEFKPYFPEQVRVTVAAGRGVAVTFDAGQVSVKDTARDAVNVKAALQPTTASITLTCIPMACSLDIKPGANTPEPVPVGDQPFTKAFGQDALVISGLPQGDYVFSVTSPATGQTLSATHGICNGEELTVAADFTQKGKGISFGTSAYPTCTALPTKTPSQ